MDLIKNIIVSLLVLLSAIASSCKKKDVGSPSLFNAVPESHSLNPSIIQEASGIIAGKINTGYLWVEEDSGHPPQLYLVKYDGQVIKTIYLKGAVNRDWEDISLAGNEIYVADIGDNALIYPDYTIYRISEPVLAADTVSQVAAIRFRYPDGSHNAEALLVDAAKKDIYIITKSDNPSRFYKLSYPFSDSDINTVSLVGSLSYTGVVSAAMSPDNKEVIIKTYTQLYHYSFEPGEGIGQLIQKSYDLLPYQTEPQGEAIAFAHDNSGFFTLSEKALAPSVNLYFYKRK